MPLTDLKIRALKPEAKSRKYADGGNLYLEVRPTGSKLWKMAYSFAGKQKTLSFGPILVRRWRKPARCWKKPKRSQGAAPT